MRPSRVMKSAFQLPTYCCSYSHTYVCFTSLNYQCMYSPIQCDNQCFSLQPSKNVLARNIARIARYSVLFPCISARSCKILWDIGILQQDSCKIRAQDLARYCRNAGERDFFLEYLAILAIFLVRTFLLSCKEKHWLSHYILVFYRHPMNKVFLVHVVRIQISQLKGLYGWCCI